MAEFCTKTLADTGAFGTVKPGINGCISNCGTSLVNKGSPPASFMPIFQMAEAVSSMEDVKIGAQAQEQAKRDLIFKILTIIFMVIPFVGEAIGTLVGSVATVARIALLLGEAGNAAMTVAEIIADPTSTPFAMLGLIAGTAGAGAARPGALEKASTARGLLKEADLAKFPQKFREKDALMQKIVKKACSAS